MSEKIGTVETGGPAFPVYAGCGPDAGMTLRQYAAIKLRVPNSGTDWLDEMIRESLRDELAAMAMQGMVTAEYAGTYRSAIWANDAYEVADAMLKAREVK